MNINNCTQQNFGMAYKQTSAVTDFIGDFSLRALKSYERCAKSIDKLSEKSKYSIDVVMDLNTDKFCANLTSKNDPSIIKTLEFDNIPKKPRLIRKFFRQLKNMIKAFGHFCNIKDKFES